MRALALLGVYAAVVMLVSLWLARRHNPTRVAVGAVSDIRSRQRHALVGSSARAPGGSTLMMAGMIFAVLMGLSLVLVLILASVVHWVLHRPTVVRVSRWLSRKERAP